MTLQIPNLQIVQFSDKTQIRICTHLINNTFAAMKGQNNNEDDNENQKIWMQNAGFLYDRLLVQKLKWPSLTFQWLPYKQQTATHRLYHCLYATHSSGNAASQHLYVAQVAFPNMRDLNEDPNDLPASKIRAISKFSHETEINKARYNPLDSQIIAARTDEGPVCIFKSGESYPISLLNGNLYGGFALEWSQIGILSGDFNGKAYFWNDVERPPLEISYGSNVGDTKIIDNQTAAIVGDSGHLSFWDFRTNQIVQSIQTTGSDKKQVYSLAINPLQRQLLITGGQDEAVKIWDRRNLTSQLHKFEGHEGSILTLQWSPVNHSIFASGSTDKKVKIWDLMRVGFQIPKDLGGTDELLFTHEGHKGSINDLSWNHHEMLLGSTEEDENTLQFYQMTNNIHELEYAQDLQYLREQCFA